MNVTLKYGQGSCELEIPSKAEVTELRPNGLPELQDVEVALQQALDRPRWRPGFEQLIKEKAPRSVAIVVPDATRPTPVKTILPSLIKRIFAARPRLRPENITILIGGGLHRLHQTKTWPQFSGPA